MISITDLLRVQNIYYRLTRARI